MPEHERPRDIPPSEDLKEQNPDRLEEEKKSIMEQRRRMAAACFLLEKQIEHKKINLSPFKRACQNSLLKEKYFLNCV